VGKWIFGNIFYLCTGISQVMAAIECLGEALLNWWIVRVEENYVLNPNK
jgi:hypothetical protein